MTVPPWQQACKATRRVERPPGSDSAGWSREEGLKTGHPSQPHGPIGDLDSLLEWRWPAWSGRLLAPMGGESLQTEWV